MFMSSVPMGAGATSESDMPMETIATGFETHLPLAAIAVRIVIAAVLGGVLGFEREWRDRPAGLRTHILVAVACAAFALISIEMVEQPVFDNDNLRADPLRLVEAITAGVAFLAAGFIIFRGGEVHGVTTGAGMWLAAAVGLATGLGMYPIAILACLVGVVVLVLLRRLETRLELKDTRSS